MQEQTTKHNQANTRQLSGKEVGAVISALVPVDSAFDVNAPTAEIREEKFVTPLAELLEQTKRNAVQALRKQPIPTPTQA